MLLLIDHRAYQLASLGSHDPRTLVNNTVALAKMAKAFQVAAILTSVISAREGLLFKPLAAVFPGQEAIDRTFINTWQDTPTVDAVNATRRKQLVIAGLWTEVCVAMPAIHAAGEGWDVTVVTDACAGVTVEGHEVAIRRMIAAGVNVITWMAAASTASERLIDRAQAWRSRRCIPRSPGPEALSRAEVWACQLQRDYIRVNPTPDARTVIEELPRWLTHYNKVHPLKALGYRSPREYITQSARPRQAIRGQQHSP